MISCDGLGFKYRVASRKLREENYKVSPSVSAAQKTSD